MISDRDAIAQAQALHTIVSQRTRSMTSKENKSSQLSIIGVVVTLIMNIAAMVTCLTKNFDPALSFA
jgi:hypothetical protein